MAEVERAHGRVDVLVNNAGVNAYFDAAAMTEAEWDSVFAVDLKGAWLCAKHVLPGMRARRRRVHRQHRVDSRDADHRGHVSVRGRQVRPGRA